MFLFIIFLLSIFFIYNINIYKNIYNIHKNSYYIQISSFLNNIYLLLYLEFLLSKFFLILILIFKGLDGLPSLPP